MTLVAELPFHERPALDLLALDVDRDEPDRTYTGVGWAKIDRIWLANGAGEPRAVDAALVLALHSADDGEVLADDIELELDLPEHPVAVLASLFLERWLPRLPAASAIVLAICNPHRAHLRRPAGLAVPLHYALGDVTSWRDVADDERDRIRLVAETWCTLEPS